MKCTGIGAKRNFRTGWGGGQVQKRPPTLEKVESPSDGEKGPHKEKT